MQPPPIANHSILGIDPGSRALGYGIIRTDGLTEHCVFYNVIRPKSKTVAMRLGEIQKSLETLFSQFQPSEAAVEQIFTCKNHQSALKLGQARGVVLAAIANWGVPVFEYSPRTVKQTIVGYGAASKAQIQQMVRVLLSLSTIPAQDCADALAIALCHVRHRFSRLATLREKKS